MFFKKRTKIKTDRMQVDFLIAGAQKSGTSALNSYLRDHKEICMAKKKEVHFFDDEDKFKTPNVDYAYYHSHFEVKPFHTRIGEATPSYMYWYDSPRRIWVYNPNMKIIIILRNPIERAFSHWNMRRVRGREDLTFIDALKNERERCRKSLPRQSREFSYLDRGFYTEQLRRMLHFFPRKHIFILKSEDLRLNTQKCIDLICDFLKVERINNRTFQPVNSKPYEYPMSEDVREFLFRFYQYEIKQLEVLLDWDCSDWLM